jgi:hypothetical protein
MLKNHSNKAIEQAFAEHGYFLGRKFLVLAPSRSQVSANACSIALLQ